MRTAGDWEAWLLFFVDAVAETAGKVMDRLALPELNLVRELTGQKRNRVYAYIDILNRTKCFSCWERGRFARKMYSRCFQVWGKDAGRLPALPELRARVQIAVPLCDR